jgi:hypothetical protein
VFFDSGAVVRAHLKDGDVVTGPLLVSFAPEAQQLVVCDDRTPGCESRDAGGARTLPLTAIERLKIPYPGTSIGADLGFRAGGLIALEHDKENEYLMMLGMLTGAVVGGVVGSRVTRWITVAEEGIGGRLRWIPESPVIIPLPPVAYHFTTVCGRGDTVPNGTIVAEVRTTDAAFYTDVRRAWQLDSATRRIFPTRTDGVRCRNAAWTSRIASASYKAEVAALSFTPSRGTARIYVYHTERRPYTDRSVSYMIAVDSLTVGQIDQGSYLMVEVEPGRHRVSVPDEDEVGVVLDAAADSAYFVRVWHKIGMRRLRRAVLFGGVRLMDPVKARAVIPTAQLVPSTWPGPLLH